MAPRACAIVFLFAIQAWVTDLTYRNGARTPYSVVMIVTALLQTLALLSLYRSLSQVSPSRIALIWIGSGAAAMTALSFVTANTNIDASAYVGYGKLPRFSDAYDPPQHLFAGNGFQIINVNWGSRLPPLDYGPLWLLLDRILLSRAGTFAQALLALRAENVVLFSAFLFCLWRLRVHRATVAVVALNPALYYYYVIQVHNDVLAILLVVVGMVIAERRPWLGAIVAGGAGLVKVPFAAFATFAFAGRRSAPLSLWLFALAIGITALGSALFGGWHYLHAMIGVGRFQLLQRADTLHMLGILLHLCVAVVAGAATVVALLTGRFIVPAAYSFCAVSTILYPWYLGWCIPYALRIPRFTGVFFISLPIIMHIVDPHFSLSETRAFALVDLFFVLILAFVVRHAWSTGRPLGSRGKVPAG